MAESQLDIELTALQTEVNNDTTVMGSATKVINGINDRIAAAVQAALAAGATSVQLKAITDLQSALSSSSTDLAKAVAANTPPAPPVTTGP